MYSSSSSGAGSSKASGSSKKDMAQHCLVRTQNKAMAPHAKKAGHVNPQTLRSGTVINNACDHFHGLGFNHRWQTQWSQRHNGIH